MATAMNTGYGCQRAVTIGFWNFTMQMETIPAPTINPKIMACAWALVIEVVVSNLARPPLRKKAR